MAWSGMGCVFVSFRNQGTELTTMAAKATMKPIMSFICCPTISIVYS